MVAGAQRAAPVPSLPGHVQRIDEPRQIPALTEPGEGGQDLLLVHLHHPEVLRPQVRDNRVIAVWKPILPVLGRQRGRVLSPYQPDGVLNRLCIYRGGEDAVPHPDPYPVVAEEVPGLQVTQDEIVVAGIEVMLRESFYPGDEEVDDVGIERR